MLGFVPLHSYTPTLLLVPVFCICIFSLVCVCWMLNIWLMWCNVMYCFFSPYVGFVMVFIVKQVHMLSSKNIIKYKYREKLQQMDSWLQKMHKKRYGEWTMEMEMSIIVRMCENRVYRAVTVSFLSSYGVLCSVCDSYFLHVLHVMFCAEMLILFSIPCFRFVFMLNL